MKKKYINPELNIVFIQQQHHLLAGSEIDMGAAGSANEAESRRRGRYDWDDEEDY
jgi:hypothetical protein